MKRLSLHARVVCALFLGLLASCSGRSAEAPKANTASSTQGAPAGSPVAIAVGDAAAQARDAQGPVPIHPDDARWGSDAAAVTMIVETDLQCPFCARADGTIRALMDRYGPSRLRVVVKHLPLEFHPLARPAALTAIRVQREKGDAAFFDYVSTVLSRQEGMSEAGLAAWADAVVPNGPRHAFQSSPEEQLERDLNFASDHGIRGTPNFLVNGRLITGAQPLPVFVAAVDGELAAIEEARAAGQPVGYDARSATNYQAPEREPARMADPDEGRLFKVPVGKSPVLGSPDALVTIVEFSDYQCPFCKRAQRTIDQVLQRYGADVRVVFKHHPLPFHDRAGPAAAFALEAFRERGHTIFWQASRSLFDAPMEALSDAALESLGKTLSLKPDKVRAALKKGDAEPEIQADVALAEAVSAPGTPCFFINGQKLQGAQPFPAFAEVIDAQLTAARAMVQAGAAPKDVYERIMTLAN